MRDIINNRIQILVSESNMSYTQLANELGVYPQYISTWTTGRSVPSLANIIAICEYFNVSSDWLLGLSDERTLLKKDATLEEALTILKRIDADWWDRQFDNQAKPKRNKK